MLCTAPVLLQTQSLARSDDDLLDLVIVPFQQVFIVPPRPVILPLVENFLVDIQIGTRHVLAGEALFHLVAAGTPVEFVNPAHRLHGSVRIGHDESRAAITNKFRH